MHPSLLAIRGLSPFGPIFAKELRIAARRKRNYVLRVVYLGGLLLFLLMVWASSSRYEGGGVAYRIQQQNALGQEFFSVFSMFCVITMGLISPVLTSTAVGSERLGKTLNVLLMTPITSWQIVCGKLLSRLLIALMLIGLSLPVLAVVRLLGGVELWQMLGVIALCAGFAMSSAAIGLFFSTLLNRAYAVILLSYAVMLFMYLFVPMMYTLTLAGKGPRNPDYQFLAAINPMFNVAILSVSGGPIRTTSSWPGMLVQLGLTAILLCVSAWMIRRYARRGGEAAAVQLPPVIPPPVDAPAAALQTAPLPLPVSLLETAGLETPSAQSRVVGDNPVLWRELRRPLLSRGWSIIAGVIVIALLLISYGGFASLPGHILREHELQIGYGWVFNGLYWLLVAVLSATAIAQEKESDTWTLLLTSPLSARSIIFGKLLGLTRRMLWPTLLVLAHFTLFTLTGIISAQALAVVIWVMLSFNLVWLVTGLYLSLRLKKVTTAVIVNMAIPMVLFIAVPLALAVLDELQRDGQERAQWVCWYLPYSFIGEAIDKLRPDDDFFWSLSRRNMWLPGMGYNNTVSNFFTAAILMGSLHLAVAAGFVWRMIARFDRIVGRAPQFR